MALYTFAIQFLGMANYYEYVFLPSSTLGDTDSVAYNWDEAGFAVVMKRLAFKNLKHYELKLKQYVKDTLHYEVVIDHKGEISEIRSYLKNALGYEFPKPNILKLSYNKHKQPIHSFSSSRDMHDVSYTRRVTYRVNNRIFINFECSKSAESGEIIRKIFINVNLDNNVDVDYINTELEQYLTLLAC